MENLFDCIPNIDIIILPLSMVWQNILFFKGVIRIPWIRIIVIFLLPACLDITPEPTIEEGSPHWAVLKLNKNTEGLKNLASACMTTDSIAIFNIKYNDDGSVIYLLGMKGGDKVEIYNEIISNHLRAPALSMKQEEGCFFWTVNGVPLLDLEGDKVSVTDLTKPISFLYHGESICCKVKNSIVGEYQFMDTDSLTKDIAFDYDVDRREFTIHLSSGYETALPTTSVFHLFDTNVPNQSFYKDLFLDAGIALTSRKSLAAAEHLGLSVEGISFGSWDPKSSESVLQKAIISGDSIDKNGRLLYPDGQPRYKLLFVNGGTSSDHGKSMGEKGLESMRLFVKNGGSYVGTCAGAFFASNGYNGKADYPYYLSIWPGMMYYTYLKNAETGMIIEPNSPLLRYYDFGGDHYVDSIRHNEGGYPVTLPLCTEILARYDYPQQGSIHKKPSIWAYKQSPQSGRVVMEGSHPEEVIDGERRDLTAAMVLYAMDGVGIASLKGYLKNGIVRVMDKNTEDNDPEHTRIGDFQTHHFATYIPPGAKNIQVEVNSSCDCDLALMMNPGTYAYSDIAEYCSRELGAAQHLFSPTLKEGLWFIGVKCMTTVTVVETEYGQAYSGNTNVLNGFPYELSVHWD